MYNNKVNEILDMIKKGDTILTILVITLCVIAFVCFIIYFNRDVFFKDGNKTMENK